MRVTWARASAMCVVFNTFVVSTECNGVSQCEPYDMNMYERLADAPIRPVTTQPMVGEMEKRCVTVEGSRSLSYSTVVAERLERVWSDDPNTS